MDPDEPTHFNAILVGTGLVESIVAAALAKAGYSVLQLDSNTYYGDEWASLTVDELVTWHQSRSSSSSGTAPDDNSELKRLSNRFSLSLRPCLLRATGPAIDIFVRSKVASYLSFGLLEATAMCRANQGVTGTVHVDRVPSSKADVFNDTTLSLVEKRRLTKLLLFAGGDEALNETAGLSDHVTLLEYVSGKFSLTDKITPALAYALCLSSNAQEPALPALKRMRTLIHSVGRYGPSPYLVGHYGGAGDLVGGFSRICAVWGGGQILGREVGPIVLDAKRGRPVPQAQAPFVAVADLAPKPPQPAFATDAALGVPVVIEAGQDPTVLTADWIGVASSHVASLLPKQATSVGSAPIKSVRAIAVLGQAIPFPSPRDAPIEDDSRPDSHMFVFAPGALSSELGTVTALQVGPGTFACPAGYHVLYLHASVDATRLDGSMTAESLLSPYLEALVSLVPNSDQAASNVAWAVYNFERSSVRVDSSRLPSNLVVIPSVEYSTTASLCTALDEAVELAENLFWQVVGDEGKKEGVQFFAPDLREGDEDE
ncbi:hypothetical protein ACM66B_002752 [Microbotryomycetes sp. NB124-2]